MAANSLKPASHMCHFLSKSGLMCFGSDVKHMQHVVNRPTDKWILDDGCSLTDWQIHFLPRVMKQTLKTDLDCRLYIKSDWV